MPDLIGHEFAQQMIEYTDGIYLSFGADKKVEGVGHDEKIKAIRLRAIQAGLKLVDCPIRHPRHRNGTGALRENRKAILPTTALRLSLKRNAWI